jgi:hypothetical protein
LCNTLCVRANIGTCSEVSDVCGCAGVFSACEGVWNGEEVWGAYHPVGYSETELLDLTANEMEEGVTGPTSDQHDHEYRYAGQVHGHGRSGPNGMSSNFVHLVSQCHFADEANDGS